MRHEINIIQIKGHNIASYKTNEISLASFEDQGYILKDG